ncbi:MAG: type II toxin-antitoxin system RelB/DinJ family antitoxin [Lachnospiraceae bacterium]|nr:type II toxin-antitoxin system RelB/DinJ family antitoxin [Lachnospiraceae bacterium]
MYSNTQGPQIRIDSTIKQQATELFASLGMDMSSAVNIFLRQCILRGGLPFPVELPKYNQETLNAMAEARRISRAPDVKGYESMADLKAALDADD